DWGRGRTRAEASSEARLPVTVITGFLGSGKTTLIKHILTNQHGLCTAVIVNELSKIGIDSDLIVSASDNMVELENGCICCSINNDFLDAIFRILNRDRRGRLPRRRNERRLRSAAGGADLSALGIAGSAARRVDHHGCRCR